MPPKPKFTRDQMITAAMNLIEERGYESLTARELGKYLGSSSCPIFTLFKDMDELKTEVKNRAVEIFNEYMAVAEEFYPAYKKRGMQWVKFAAEQPRLFRLLFMQETSGQADFDAAQKIIPFGKQNDIDIIMRDYNASRTPFQTNVDLLLRALFARRIEGVRLFGKGNRAESRRDFQRNDLRDKIR